MFDCCQKMPALDWLFAGVYNWWCSTRGNIRVTVNLAKAALVHTQLSILPNHHFQHHKNKIFPFSNCKTVLQNLDCGKQFTFWSAVQQLLNSPRILKIRVRINNIIFRAPPLTLWQQITIAMIGPINHHCNDFVTINHDCNVWPSICPWPCQRWYQVQQDTGRHCLKPQTLSSSTWS